MAFDSNFVQSLDQTFDPLPRRGKKISNEFLLDAKRCYPRGALDELLRFERAERRKGGRKSAEEIQERGTFNLRLSLPPSRGKKLRLRDNKASADPFETSIENRAALSRRFACTLPSCGSWGRNIQGGVWFLKILGETLPLFSILSSSSFFFSLPRRWKFLQRRCILRAFRHRQGSYLGGKADS